MLRPLFHELDKPLAGNGHPRLTRAFLTAAAVLAPLTGGFLGTKLVAALFAPASDAAVLASFNKAAMIYCGVVAARAGYEVWRNSAWLSSWNREP